jgi:formylglycine-generating enzyme required for sulfatase activity
MLTCARCNWPIPVGFLVAAAMLGLLSGCADESSSLTRPLDSTPPAGTSLTFGDVTPTSVALTWRAPGDDGMTGNAASYDLRYSTAEFDEETFEAAALVDGLDRPSAPRSLERTTIMDLSPGQTYFFAIRTRDERGNWSPLSPVVNISTPLEEGYPVLMSGRLVHSAGTTSTGFLFQVTWRVPDPEDLPTAKPWVVIGDSAYAMVHLPADPPGNELYEYTAHLAPGEYTYYFEVYDDQEQYARLPNPGGWHGPSVVSVSITSPETVTVPAGSFQMGNASPDAGMFERPAHEVTLTQELMVDRYEVTNAQLCEAYNWALAQGWLFVKNDTLVTHFNTGKTLLRCAPRISDAPHGIIYSSSRGFMPMPFRENWPAAYVTWYGAAIYCNARSALDGYAVAHDPATWESETIYFNPYDKEGWRLPSEAEWEYMASHGGNPMYPTGDATPVAGVDGNFAGTLDSPADVGSFTEGATSLGLFDLAGNVYEWCVDWFALYEAGAVTNPRGGRLGQSRVIRGGSWSSPIDELRCDHRFSTKPERSYDGLGFRCVRSMIAP